MLSVFQQAVVDNLKDKLPCRQVKGRIVLEGETMDESQTQGE